MGMIFNFYKFRVLMYSEILEMLVLLKILFSIKYLIKGV